MTSITLHFSGEFAEDHQISLRTLSKSLSSLRRAIDRAYLDIKYEGVWKNARMSRAEYEEIKFLVQLPEEGGFRLSSIPESFKGGKTVIKRIAEATLPAFDLGRLLQPEYESNMQKGLENAAELVKDLDIRKIQLENRIITPTPYQEVAKSPENFMVRSYGDRSIAKEIDQMISPLRSDDVGESFIELELAANEEDKTIIQFDTNTSNGFHQVASRRLFGKPIVYRIRLISLDNKNLQGKVFNMESKKESSIFLSDYDNFLKLHPHLAAKDSDFLIIGCPVIQYGTFDIKAGDIYFLDLWSYNE